MSTNPPQSRAKFSAEIGIDKVTLIFADGRTEEHAGEDARTLGLSPTGESGALSAMQMLRSTFEKQGINPLHKVPDKILASTAKHGTGWVHASQVLNFVDVSAENFDRNAHGRVITGVKIDYTITVIRVPDA